MPFGPTGPTLSANLSYTTAKKLLSQGEIDRILCAVLNATEPIKFDATKAVAEWGSGSVSSFQQAVGLAASKVKKNMSGP